MQSLAFITFMCLRKPLCSSFQQALTLSVKHEILDSPFLVFSSLQRSFLWRFCCMNFSIHDIHEIENLFEQKVMSRALPMCSSGEYPDINVLGSTNQWLTCFSDEAWLEILQQILVTENVEVQHRACHFAMSLLTCMFYRRSSGLRSCSRFWLQRTLKFSIMPVTLPWASLPVPPKGGRGCLMSPPCLESQGCYLIPLCYLLSCSSA